MTDCMVLGPLMEHVGVVDVTKGKLVDVRMADMTSNFETGLSCMLYIVP